MKKTFILYTSWHDSIKKLSNEDAGKLFELIFLFVKGEDAEIQENIEGLYLAITEQIVFEWSKFNPKTQKYHWNYQGGISSENHIIRNSTEIKIWRKRVFERDNYTCQYCEERGSILNAHHIKPFALYPELRFESKNGITLCKKCHIELHKRDRKNEE